MAPLTNIFGSDDDEPVEPGSYPLQPFDEDGLGEDGVEDDAAVDTPPDPLLGPDDGDLTPPDAG